MGLKFYPRAGQIFIGDFSDLKEPEITKKRPVIVISPRLPYRSELVAIVPISLTEPRHKLPFCYKLSRNYHPQEPDDLNCWAKCDLVMNVSIRRLNCFKIGRRNYIYPTLIPEDLQGVKNAVLFGLGMGDLLQPSL